MWVVLGFFAYGCWNVVLTLYYILKGFVMGSKHPGYDELRDSRQEAVLAILVSWTCGAALYYFWYMQ